MNKIAYIDCSSGISGDMFIGAFLDAGLSLKLLENYLRKLPFSGYKIKASKVKRGHIQCTKFDVVVNSSRNNKPRSVEDIINSISRSDIPTRAKDIAIQIFRNLQRSEAKIHGAKKLVHLHELADLDSIVDIVGAGLAVAIFGIQKIFFSNVSFGRGSVKTRSGILPIPSPATVELMRGNQVKFIDTEHELVTPTGAAILKTLGENATPPLMKIGGVGYGAGTSDLEDRPNAVRVIIGSAEKDYLKDSVYVMEAAIDDMSPVFYADVFRTLFEAGALDVYITPVYMKKQRPGHLLTVIAEKEKLHSMAEVIFKETTTLGLRFYEADRFKLERRFDKVKTRFGDIDVKVAKSGGSIYNTMPEYEALKKRAKAMRVPVREVYNSAMKKILKTFLIAASLGAFFANTLCLADSIYLKDGEVLKGVIVEEYKDRLTVSTIDGEKMIERKNIDKMIYDETERNLVALADRYRAKGQLYEAYNYYSKAYKINPEFTQAKDGMFFVSGYLFRKIGADKEREVQRRQEIEEKFKQARAEKPPTERLLDEVGIALESAGNNVKIKDVVKNSPADEAGIRRGDIIISVWGKLTGYMQLNDVVTLLLQAEIGELRIVVERDFLIEPRSIKGSYTNLIDAGLAMKLDGLTLVNVKENGIAYKAGLRDEDLIIDLDNKPTRYMPLEKAIRITESKRGRPLDLAAHREIVVWKRKKEM